METAAEILRQGLQQHSNERQTQKQIGYRVNGTTSRLRRHPPFIRPERMPSRIVADHFNQEELELMSKYLATYQKGEVGWDVFRLKIPTELLKKLEAVLVECRSNGFINPIVSIGERGDYRLLWSQILSRQPRR